MQLRALGRLALALVGKSCHDSFFGVSVVRGWVANYWTFIDACVFSFANFSSKDSQGSYYFTPEALFFGGEKEM